MGTEDNKTSIKSDEVRVKTSSRAVIVTGLVLFLLLFGVGGVWTAYADLSGAVIAQGNVAVLGKPKTVQHLDGGIVATINIKDGDRVNHGDVLIRLDDILLTANLQIYQNRLREATTRQARLMAERDALAAIVWDDKLLDLLKVQSDPVIRQGQQKLFEARRITREGQVSQLNQKIAQFKNQINGTKALKQSKGKQLDLLEGELYGMRVLKAKGLALTSQLMNLERQKEDLVGQRAEHDAELARIRNAINETEIQILQIDREFRQSVLTEMREVEQEVNDMTQQLQATYEKLKRVEIKAPVDGIIHELSVFTIGGVIGPGDPILQIIPQDEKFEVEAKVEPQFIDELYVGQPATLRFSAFNQRTTPELTGTVTGISANVMVDEQSGMPFYTVRINVPDEELARLKGQPLIPGMPVEAFVKTKNRTALNYLVKPLLDQVNRSFKEE
ncbi:MAG: HlyD family type I secretion periplasmic adaptor subunit [Rhodobacteraceae bacterium]|nr:HlyD family type I secretion periplasmic adaptor subunit [Paracoccaceae bacterium]